MCVAFIAYVPMPRTMKTENLTEYPTLMDLLNENYNKKYSAGSKSNIMQGLENLFSNFCPYFKFFTEDPDNGNE
jgi:hypothetical protein